MKPDRPLLVPGLLVGAGGVLAIALTLKLCSVHPVTEPTSTNASFAPASAASATARASASTAASEPTASAPTAVSAPSTPQIYAAAETPSSEPHPTGAPLRAMDRDILERIAKNDVKRLDDVFPDRPYRVQMTRNMGDGYIILVRIDMHRKNVWDERWRLTHNAITRDLVQPNDPTNVVPFALRNGRWVPF